MTWNFHLNFPVSRVVGQDVAGHVLDARLVVALLGGVADHDHVVDDDRRRRAGDVAELERDARVRVVRLLGLQPGLPVRDEILQQVDRAGLREARDRNGPAPVRERLAGLGIERVQEERRRGDEDHAAAVDARVGDALAVVGAHRVLEPAGRRLLERPQRLAGGRVERHDGAPRARDGDQHAVDVDRQAAGVDLAAEVDAGISRRATPRRLSAC